MFGFCLEVQACNSIEGGLGTGPRPSALGARGYAQQELGPHSACRPRGAPPPVAASEPVAAAASAEETAEEPPKKKKKSAAKRTARMAELTEVLSAGRRVAILDLSPDEHPLHTPVDVTVERLGKGTITAVKGAGYRLVRYDAPLADGTVEVSARPSRLVPLVAPPQVRACGTSSAPAAAESTGEAKKKT